MSIIEVKNIGKKYNISHRQGGYLTLRDILSSIFGHPLRFIKNKARAMTGLAKKEEFWALKNINFNVEKGEVIGIIGHNGAGKSTLLKILSQITTPTEGEIKIEGRVGSLLEVGTGFHPELTGRENIFLNGAILGMKRQEIADRFNEIVEFAGIEKFLDTPVKYYSSGMYVRLAFAVAAHMEPDILIIDEVLAVGDADFQKKCLGKMDEITKKEGRTILFVSHNMGAIRQLCQRCILLEKGEVVMNDKTGVVLDYYLNKDVDGQAVLNFDSKKDKEAEITKISILNKDNRPSIHLSINESFFIEFEYTVYSEIDKSVCALFVFSVDGDLLLFSSDGDRGDGLKRYQPGVYKSRIEVPAFLFNVGYYDFNLAIEKPFVEYIDLKEKIRFEILDVDNPRSIVLGGNNIGKIAPILNYSTIKVK